ncbi:uncharacterized protein PG986_012889 [Apiospora aurea]|uniref:LysM domain-containing protein n=1 Tax=Apiospora aurea TaxID=335848 RepID=A0ABR1Q2H0_9PEZI
MTGTTSSYDALQVVPIVSNTPSDVPATDMYVPSSSSTLAALPGFPTPPASCDPASSYTVKMGDTCFIIARAHGITPAEILQANPQMNNDCDLIYIDQVICLPTGSATVPGATSLTDSSSSQQGTSSTTSDQSTSTSDQPFVTTTSTTGEEVIYPTGSNSAQGMTSISTSTSDQQSFITTATSTTGDGSGASSSSPSTADDSSASPSSTSTSTRPVADACTLSHTVVAGDTCHNIWSKYSLTVDTFLALNPHLSMRPDGYCGLDVGDVVCVGGDPKGPGETSHPESPSDLEPHLLSELQVIPVSTGEGQAVPHPPAATETTDATGASRRLLRRLPVTFRTSTVRETSEE